MIIKLWTADKQLYATATVDLDVIQGEVEITFPKHTGAPVLIGWWQRIDDSRSEKLNRMKYPIQGGWRIEDGQVPKIRMLIENDKIKKP